MLNRFDSNRVTNQMQKEYRCEDIGILKNILTGLIRYIGLFH